MNSRLRRLRQLAESAEKRGTDPQRHKCFVSYHVDDTAEVETFIEDYGHVFIPYVIGVTEDDDFVESDDTGYIMQRIRETSAEYESVEVTEDFPPLDLIRSVGLVGHDYAHECRHVAPTTKTDPEAGIAYLKEYARYLVAAVKALEPFEAELEGGEPS